MNKFTFPNLRDRRRIIVAVAFIILLVAVIGGGFGFARQTLPFAALNAAVNSYAMVQGETLNASCPNTLGVTPVPPSSATLLCAANTPTVTPTNTMTSVPTQTATAVPPSGPIALAFHYPWFPGAWDQQGINPFTQYHPSLGFYTSSDMAIVNQQIDLATGAHLQGFISSWWGRGSREDVTLQAIIPASASSRPDFRWAIYYEAEGQGDPTTPAIASDLTYLTPLFNSPNYLHVNGAPVVFVYADGADGAGMASRWAAAKTSYGQPLYYVLKVYSGYKLDPNQPSSWHQYAPAVRIDNQAPYAVSVSPGFYKAGEAAPRLARDVTAFGNALTTMRNLHPQFELITTWNEWGEGSSVEPASEFGTSYLDALCAALPGPTPCTPGATAVPTASPTILPTSTPIATASATGTPPATGTVTPIVSTATETSTVLASATAVSTVASTVSPLPTATGPSVSATPTTLPSPSTTPPSTPTRTATVGASGGVPNFDHIYVLLMENKEYGSIVGSSAAPYENQLIAQYGLYTNYDGVAHPSEPNYLALAAGSTLGVTDDGVYNFSSSNLADQIENSGRTWRVWAENISSSCYTGATSSGGPDGTGSYARKHEPFISFTQISGNATRCGHITNFTNYANAPANFTFIAPNQDHSTHDQNVAFGDAWLAGWVPSHILNQPAWSSGKNALFIVWDEGTSGTGGGGHVAAIMVSNVLKSAGIKSATLHSHYSWVRTIEDAWGLGCLAQSCSANNMGELFQ